MKNVEDLYPLSPMQEGMLFHALYAPGSGAYAVHISFKIEGSLNIAAFKRSWQALVDRHTILRTALVWEQVNRPLQVVKKQASLGWEEFDWRDRSPEEQEQELHKYIQEQHRRGFDLAQAPLMRMALMRLGEKSYQFVWNYSHILLDAWSVNILFSELLRYFRADSEGLLTPLPSPRPYREFIAWLQQQDKTQAEEFWRKRLEGFSNPTSIRGETTASDPSDHGPRYQTQTCNISKTVALKLQAIARQHRFTLTTFIECAWAWVLGHYCHSDDVVFGVTVNGRPVSLKRANEIVGLLVNTLPARVQIQFDRYLLEWLKTVHDHQVENREFGFCSLVDIKTWSDIQGAKPLFESLVVFENYPVTGGMQELDDSVRLVGSSLLQNSAYPLAIAAEPNEDGMTLRLHFDTQRFRSARTATILHSVKAILELMAENPEMKVRELTLTNVVSSRLQGQRDAELADIDYICELSPMQEQRLAEGDTRGRPLSCLAQAVFTVEEDINLAHFEACLRTVMEQHDVLRVSTLWEGLPHPVQVVHRTAPLRIQQQDWKCRSQIENRIALHELLRADREREIPFSEAPPFRVQLLEFPGSRSGIIVTYDQFRVDSWSIRKMIRSVLSTLSTPCEGAELSTAENGSYRDWVKWLNQQDYSAAEAFWKAELDHMGPPTLLGDAVSSIVRADSGLAIQNLSFSETLIQQLRYFGAQHELQLTTIVLGAWAILLSRYTYQSDLVVGATISCRAMQPSCFNDVLGNLVALIPLRLQVCDQDLLLPWLTDLQRHTVKAFKYGCRMAGIKRYDVQSLHFDHIISLDDCTDEEENTSANEPLHVNSVSGSFGLCPMTLTVRTKASVSLSCVYSTNAFGSQFVERMLGHFEYLIEQIVNDSTETLRTPFDSGIESVVIPEIA